MIQTKKENASLKTVLLSVLVMALWGSLYPFVKIGYAAFSIDSGSVADILMFAGLRFLISGVAVCIIARAKKQILALPKGKNVLNILLWVCFPSCCITALPIWV